jgi:predicted RNA-binding Zn-ribbon protein involved in translation (DUF1610 family)
MPFHFFPTPVECKNCGAVVDDPSTQHCPKCGKLLMERRTPSRLAGVERKYENLRVLLAFVRFMGIATALFGALMFLFFDDSIDLFVRLSILFGGMLLGTCLFVIATLIEIVADLEENTRAIFRVQQTIEGALVPSARSERSVEPAREVHSEGP